VAHFLVDRAKGPAWDHSRPRREQEGWDEHAAFMDALVEEGFVVLGGPVGEGDGENALLVVEADDEQTVRTRLAEDPWPLDVLTIESVQPWSLWLRPAGGDADSGQLLTALSTEHFTLQGARSQTMSESSARASVYVFAVSSALVALGFVGQISDLGDVFNVFALTVLPTLYLLGCVTFVRLVECGAEDFQYGLAINRIRGYYKELARDRANLFLLSAHDDGAGVFANMGLAVENRSPLFAFSSAIDVINSVVGGGAVAVALGALVDAPLGVAAGVGAASAIVSVVAWLRYADRLLEAGAARTEPLFPSASG
jgi:uncharacterized protein YciI